MIILPTRLIIHLFGSFLYNYPTRALPLSLYSGILYILIQPALSIIRLFRAFLHNHPTHALLLPFLQVAIDDYLARLQQADFDIFHKQLQAPNPSLPWKLFKTNWRKAY